jgi:hypothetical protein
MQDAVRQYLYIDVDRVRSYLAQLDEGVLESVVETVGSEEGPESRRNCLVLDRREAYQEPLVGKNPGRCRT